MRLLKIIVNAVVAIVMFAVLLVIVAGLGDAITKLF